MSPASVRKFVLDMVHAEFVDIDPDTFELSTEVYGDDIETSHDLLDEHDCIEPGGHVFLARCGNVRCIHCERKA